MRALAFVLLAVAPLAADPKPLPKTPLSEGRKLLNHGNHVEARTAFEAHLKDAKYGPAAAIGIAQAWRAEGNVAKARLTLDLALKLFENHPDLLAARGDLLFEAGEWTEARADADAAIKKEDGHFLARWVRARILRDSGKLDEADAEMRWFVRAYTAASNADKDITDPDLLVLIGQAGAENARWHNLSKQFSFILNDIYGDALKIDPDLWTAEYLIGAMFLEKYNRPDAVESFDKALKLNPNAAEPYIGKGQAALQKYEIKEAAEFAAEALKRNPKLPAALRFKADVHLISGELDEAVKALKDAIAINPKDEIAYGKLAACLLMLKRPNEADAARKLVAAFDARPGLFDQEMGEYLEDRRFYTKAQEAYARAGELRPNLAAPRCSQALLHLRMGEEEEGRKLLDAAFQADKFNVRVANMRKVMDHLSKYEVIRTAHYDVKFDPTKDRVLAEFVAEYLEEVHAELKRQFAYEPPGRTPFEVFSKHEMFSGRTVGLPDLHTIGACTGRVVAMASPKAQGIMRPFNWGRVIRHELVHVFNLTQTDFQCPHWLTEGLAVRNEATGRPALWTQVLRAAADDGTLFNLDTVMLGFVKPKDQAQWTLAYCQSHLYVEYLVSRFGEGVIAKLLKAYAENQNTDAAILSSCGATKAEIEKGYRASIDEVLKPFRGARPKDDPTARMTLKELEAALEQTPDDLNVKARLAELALKRSKPAEARKLSDEVLEKKPAHATASVVRARLLQQAGDDDGAKEALAAALKAHADEPRLLLALGRFHVEANELEKAATVLEAGRKAAPLDGDWLEQLARVYTTTKQSDKLAAVLKEIAEHDPDDLDTRLKLIRTLMPDEPKVALKFAKEALQIDATHADTQALYLECLTKTGGDTEKAAKRFGK